MFDAAFVGDGVTEPTLCGCLLCRASAKAAAAKGGQGLEVALNEMASCAGGILVPAGAYVGSCFRVHRMDTQTEPLCGRHPA